jgi:putative tributyrin esterase
MQNLPIILLLHGVYGSHWSWFFQGGVHLIAQEMIAQGDIPPIAIACPSDGLQGEGSGYLPLPQADYESWIGEVPEIVSAAASCCSASSPIFLAGLSMGGYGALRLGMKYPHRYVAVSAHSAITAPEQFRQFFEPEDADNLLAAATADWQLLQWADRHRNELPPLRFDCGLGDSLFHENEALHQSLSAISVPHSFEALSGTHDWSYWGENIRRTFKFFAQICRARESAT